MLSIRIIAAFLLVQLGAISHASNDAPCGFPWIDPEGVHGTVVVTSSSDLLQAVRNKVRELDGEAARTVLIRPASATVDALLIDPPELPGTIVAAGPLDEQQRDRLVSALTKCPDHIGIVIDPAAALVVRGRQIDVRGDSTATLMLAASAGRALREIELKAGSRHDLTMLRRAAHERSLANFPPPVPPPPVVPSGSLVIVGGGTLSDEITQKFIELAGGADAPIVVLPIAAEGTLSEDISRDIRSLTRAGATNVKSLRARQRSEVESPEFAAALSEAKGVWFNGGRQWRFVDAYMGTKAEELLRDVLGRGGVIGGSSAGASIQSEYMPRGSPLGNTDMMADGYERGLCFLPGTAIDQHFTQRKRHADMTHLMRRYPQLLGIGIDESTAIVVQMSTAQVIGRGNVHFYDYRTGPPGGERDYFVAEPGQRFDLVERKRVESPR